MRPLRLVYSYFCVSPIYYLHNKEAVSAYIADWLEWSHRMQEEQRRNPSPTVIKLRKLLAEKPVLPSSFDLYKTPK